MSVISQLIAVGTLLVSDGVPIMMISVLFIFSFRKFELSHVFISCTQTEILSIWVETLFQEKSRSWVKLTGRRVGF